MPSTSSTAIISKKDLDDAEAIAIAQTIHAKKNLKKISLALRGDNISSAGAIAIAQAIEANKGIFSQIFLNLRGDIDIGGGCDALIFALIRVCCQNAGVERIDAYIDDETIFYRKSHLYLWFLNDAFHIAYAETIAKIFKTNTNFTKFSLELNNNHTGYTKAIVIAQAISNNKKLSELTLELRNKRICEKGATAIAKAIETNKNFIKLTLNLSRNYIRDTGAIAIAQAIQTNKSLLELELNLNPCAFGSKGVWALTKALLEMYCQNTRVIIAARLEHSSFYYKKNRLCFSLPCVTLNFADITIIIQSIKANKKLTKLSLDFLGWDISNTQAIAIAQAIKTNKNLIELSLTLWNNSICDTGAAAIIQAIQANKNLTSISLSLWRSNISPKEEAAIAKFLLGAYSQNTGMAIDVSLPKGRIYRGRSASTNVYLDLDLTNTNLNEVDATAIAQTIQADNSFTQILLKLWGNNIGPKGQQILTKVLIEACSRSTLVEIQAHLPGGAIQYKKEPAYYRYERRYEDNHLSLKLTNDTLSLAYTTAIAQVFKANSKLTKLSLHLGSNNIGTKKQQTLAKAHVTAIAQIIQDDNSLTKISLNLWDTNINPEGQWILTKVLLEACGQNKLVKIAAHLPGGSIHYKNGHLSLRLTNSTLSPAHTTAIAQAFKANSKLTKLSLHLGSNNVGKTLAKAVIEACGGPSYYHSPLQNSQAQSKEQPSLTQTHGISPCL